MIYIPFCIFVSATLNHDAITNFVSIAKMLCWYWHAFYLVWFPFILFKWVYHSFFSLLCCIGRCCKAGIDVFVTVIETGFQMLWERIVRMSSFVEHAIGRLSPWKALWLASVSHHRLSKAWNGGVEVEFPLTPLQLECFEKLSSNFCPDD